MEDIRRLHLLFAERCGLGKTYCPSEVAKAFLPESWRDQMHLVREVANVMANDDKLAVMQNGEIIFNRANLAKGPIRLRKK